MVHPPAVQLDGHFVRVCQAFELALEGHTLRLKFKGFFHVFSFHGADFYAGTAFDAVIIRQNQLAGFVDMEGTGGADVGTRESGAFRMQVP